MKRPNVFFLISACGIIPALSMGNFESVHQGIAAEKGDTQAQETLGNMYLRGNGVPQDAEEAAKWLKKQERVTAAMGEITITRPVVLGDIHPPYTDEARKAGISGTVTVQCIVRIDGTADSCRVLKGLGYGLDESAVKTIEKEGRFTPAKVKDKAIGGPINITIFFSINQ